MQHFCTGATPGTNKHARWTGQKQLPKNCGKLRKIAENCENLQTSISTLPCTEQTEPTKETLRPTTQGTRIGTNIWYFNGEIRNEMDLQGYPFDVDDVDILINSMHLERYDSTYSRLLLAHEDYGDNTILFMPGFSPNTWSGAKPANALRPM